MDDRSSPSPKSIEDAIASISERCYFAGWNAGIEYDVWKAIQDDGVTTIGHGEVDEAEKESLRSESLNLDGWVTWGPHDDEPRFVSMNEWHDLLKARQ